MSTGLFLPSRKQKLLTPILPIKKPKAPACEKALPVSVIVGETEDLSYILGTMERNRKGSGSQKWSFALHTHTVAYVPLPPTN